MEIYHFLDILGSINPGAHGPVKHAGKHIKLKNLKTRLFGLVITLKFCSVALTSIINEGNYLEGNRVRAKRKLSEFLAYPKVFQCH